MRRSGLSGLLIAFLALACGTARSDDGIFPSAPKAKPFIDFDGRGFLIRGKRTFLASGSLHYPRVPHELWRDRLLRFKRAGFNTVQTYAFWNFHETKKGEWNFSGDYDLNAFLRLVKDLGMYAVVRPGPYVCAEWDSGGYPVWLRFEPGMRVREPNAEFEAAVDRWYDKVLPIVAQNQIHRGGAVIMVQLENEHPKGWGKEMPNAYFTHLRDKAVQAGIEVPYFFSGLHHGSDPAGNREWDSKGRTNPWYSTEFWPGWYDLYGPLPPDRERFFDRGLWKILAYGGNGFNFYMLHGGTNFATWNNDEDASSYDYAAAVGQAGDLRPIYFKFKRATQFATSFPDILENSENATDEIRKRFEAAKQGVNLKITARRSPSGTIVFLDNPTQQNQAVGNGLTVNAGEITALVENAPLTPDITLALTNCRILGKVRQGDTTTLVVYGPSGGAIGGGAFVPRLNFRLTQASAAPPPGMAFFRPEGGDPQTLALNPEFTNEGVREYRLALGKSRSRFRVLAINEETADRTWFVEDGDKSWIVVGPNYVGDVETKDGKLQVVGEQPFRNGVTQTILCYGEADAPQTLLPTPTAGPQIAEIALTDWTMRSGDEEARPDFAATTWKASDTPLPMGADGDAGAYAWYRATLYAPSSGKYRLTFMDAGDWLTVFVNGKPAGSSTVKQRFSSPQPRRLEVTLNAGDNALAVLTAHYGRQKLFNHLGPIDRIDAKGISGPVLLAPLAQGEAADAVTTVSTWRWQPETGANISLNANAIPSGERDANWKPALIGEDVFAKRRGWAWYEAKLPDFAHSNRVLHFESVDDNAVVFLNGKRLMAHEGWNEPFDVLLDSAWNANGSNTITILVQNTDNTGGIAGDVSLQTLPDVSGQIRGWRMRGGIGEPDGANRKWEPLVSIGKPVSAGTGVPTWYRATFTADPPKTTGPHPILRASLAGMSRGFVWLNGHNLGRYPERVPVDGIYLPECWLKPNGNTLAIFDEEGRLPAQIKIVTETAASRRVTMTTAR